MKRIIPVSYSSPGLSIGQSRGLKVLKIVEINSLFQHRKKNYSRIPITISYDLLKKKKKKKMIKK